MTTEKKPVSQTDVRPKGEQISSDKSDRGPIEIMRMLTMLAQSVQTSHVRR